MPTHVEWPILDQLWDVVRDSESQAFLRSQGTLEEYTPAAQIFVGCMSLIVRGLPLNHLIVVFRALAPPWYNTVDKIERAAIMEIFEEAQAWVDNKLVSKMKSFSQMWYSSPAGSAFYEAWHHAKYVLFLIIL